MAGSALSDQGLEHAYVQKENMDGTEFDNHRLVYGDQFCLRSDQIMTSFFVTLAKFCMSFVRGLRDPEFRALFIALAGLLLSGTIFYSTIEGWGLVDSLYFCVMTLSTVGLIKEIPLKKMNRMKKPHRRPALDSDLFLLMSNQMCEAWLRF